MVSTSSRSGGNFTPLDMRENQRRKQISDENEGDRR